MAEFRFLPIISVFLLIVMLAPAVSGERVEDSADVDIDRYITVEMVFDEGDHFDIEATVTSSRDPVSVYLFKGEQDLQMFIDTEEVDIDAIKAGENTTDSNNTFRVIMDFSRENVTSFQESISIGEKDTYYLVIAIHRVSGMSKEEVLGLGTRVNYKITYEEVEKDVPYYLIPIAALVFIIGIGLIVLYFRMGSKEAENEKEAPIPERGRYDRRPPARMNRERSPQGRRYDRR